LSERVTLRDIIKEWCRSSEAEKAGLTQPKRVVTTEFELEDTGRRADVVAAEWKDSHEITCVCIECKKKYRPREISEILQNQVAEYTRFFPHVFLAVPEPKKEDLKEQFRSLCSIYYAGLMVVRGGHVEVVGSPETNPSFDHENYVSNARSLLALYLTFVDLFPEGEVFVGKGWCCTKPRDSDKPDMKQVQFNAGGFRNSMTFGVNHEDIREVARFPEDKLLNALSQLGQRFVVSAWLEPWPAPRGRIRFPLLSKVAPRVNKEDIDFLKTCTAQQKKGNVHLNIRGRIWRDWEVISREECEERMNEAKRTLQGIYEMLQV